MTRFFLPVLTVLATLFLLASVSSSIALAGSGGIRTATPLVNSISAQEFCLQTIGPINVEHKTATFTYKTCADSTAIVPAFLDVATITLDLTATGSTLQRPFLPAVTTTTLTFSTALGDMPTLRDRVKILTQRAVNGT